MCNNGNQLLSFILSITFISISGFQYDSCFSKHSNHYLEQSGRIQLPNMVDKAECLSACLMAELRHGFYCNTVMWQKLEHKCVLSRWSIAQKRSRLRKATAGDIDLYSNHCYLKAESKKQLNYKKSAGTDERYIRNVILLDSNANNNQKSTNNNNNNNILLSSVTKTLSQTHHASVQVPDVKTGISQTNKDRHLNASAIISSNIDVISNTNHVKAQVIDSALAGDSFSSQPWHRPPIRNVPIMKHHYPSAATTMPTKLPSTILPTSTSTTTLAVEERTTNFIIPQRTTIAIKPLRYQQQRNVIDKENTLTTTSKPPTPILEVNEKVTVKLFNPCFRLNKGYFLRGFAERMIQSVDLRKCLISCLESLDFYCASVNYNDKSSICVLNGGNSRLNQASIERASNMDYYENLCSPLSTVAKTSKTDIILNEEVLKRCITGQKDSTLLSLMGDIQPNVESLTQCISLCLLSKSRTLRACTAVNWLGNMKSCILFKEIIDSKLISNSPGSYVYENRCSGEKFEEVPLKTNDKEDYYDSN